MNNEEEAWLVVLAVVTVLVLILVYGQNTMCF